MKIDKAIDTNPSINDVATKMPLYAGLVPRQLSLFFKCVLTHWGTIYN